mmetsp:Transcript_47793/g.84146  ORF Transcript_47793/g.84146 Transcript_47793/m.84146 type:complete len:185 (+) Transcript_47793:90-644(+)
MAGSAWKKLRRFRHRDLLQGTLLRMFEPDQHECRVIQSDAFRPFLSRWADILVDRGTNGASANGNDVPKEVQDHAQKSRDADVRWLVRRLLSKESMHRGPAHFPSTLLQRGPQYPFQPQELTYLRTRVGSLRGTELTERVELPEPKLGSETEEQQPPRDLWAEGCMDDADLMDFRKPPDSSLHK